LAFLAPGLVEAVIEERLPRVMGVARLCDLPAEWSRQRQMLGLTPAEVRKSNRSLPVAVSVSGKRDFEARERGAKKPR
jgi:hypothetical protein